MNKVMLHDLSGRYQHGTRWRRMRPSDRVGDLHQVATQLPCQPCAPQPLHPFALALLPELSEFRLRMLQPVEQLVLDLVPDLAKLLQHLLWSRLVARMRFGSLEATALCELGHLLGGETDQKIAAPQ
jgi:hypothetical protein